MPFRESAVAPGSIAALPTAVVATISGKLCGTAATFFSACDATAASAGDINANTAHITHHLSNTEGA